MPTASELLDKLNLHEHPVKDSDTYYVIDPDTRQISNSSGQNVIMQYDHASESLTFELPRYVDGHDMTMCNVVIVHWNNIDAKTKRETADATELYDLQVNPDNEDTVICSWLITRDYTQRAGMLSFLIQYKCVNDDGTVTYEWHSDIYNGVEIRAGRSNTATAVKEYTDILEQWRARLFGAGESVLADIVAEGDSQVANIEEAAEAEKASIALKGEETLKTIPADYTTAYNMAEEALREKANVIEMDSEGEVIFVNNSADAYLLGFNLYGKTTQLKTTGKNVLDVEENFTWSGTYSKDIAIPAGTYIITWASSTPGGDNAPQIRFVSNDKWVLLGTSGGSVTMEFARDETHIYVYSNGSSYDNSEGVTSTVIQLMVSTDGGTYEPYTGGKAVPNPDYPQELESIENPTVTIYGKNILEFNHAYNYLPTNATLIEELENGVVLQGAEGAVPGGSTYSSGWYQVRYNNRIPLKAGQTVTISFDYTVLENPYATTKDVSLHISAKNSYSLNDSVPRPADGVTTRLSRTVTIEKDDEYFFTIGLNSCKVRVENIQLEFGDKPTDYEPYKSAQSITLNRSLPGVPVSSGGNYTDENGQQWICDEVDFNRGVYVQRVIRKTFSASVNEAWRVYTVHSQRTHTAYQESKLCADMKVSTGNASDTAELLSDKYAALMLTAVYNDGTQGIAVSNVSPAIRMCVDVCQGYTIEEFREWLKENPFDVLYPLATPIETALTEDEITLYKRLKTYYHNTTVMNDTNAYMDLKYAADTKMFFENHSIATDDQVQAAVDAYLEAHYISAEGVSF